MTRYAAATDVTSARSREEIERTVSRYGASKFLYGWEDEPARAVIAFQMRGRRIRLELPLPDPDDDEYCLTPTGLARSGKSAREAYEQAVRQRWRALALVVKAKLEAVETGIADFDTEWLGYIELPGGQTYSEWAVPQIDQAYASGEMPALLPGSGGAGTRLLPAARDKAMADTDKLEPYRYRINISYHSGTVQGPHALEVRSMTVVTVKVHPRDNPGLDRIIATQAVAPPFEQMVAIGLSGIDHAIGQAVAEVERANGRPLIPLERKEF